jgi:phosphoesterase RecJ-like protein
MSRSEMPEAVRILRESESFLIAGHTNPDGDCLGSMCALILALSSLGKSAFAVTLEGVPDLYRFLPGSERILTEVPAGRRFDAAIVLDSDRSSRIGPVSESLTSCDRLLVLDHHLGETWTEGVRILDPSVASCGELVFELLIAANVKVTSEIADCLFTSIMTDTGSFRHSNVKPQTLRNAAELVASGASPDKIARNVYESRSLAATRLLGIALSNIQTVDAGRIAYTTITMRDIVETGAVEADTEGIVSYVRSIRNSRIAIFFREVEEGARVSLRSTAGDDVSAIAREFGGGGHRAAAGCTVERPFDEVIGVVLEAVRRWTAS